MIYAFCLVFTLGFELSALSSRVRSGHVMDAVEVGPRW